MEPKEYKAILIPQDAAEAFLYKQLEITGVVWVHGDFSEEATLCFVVNIPNENKKGYVSYDAVQSGAYKINAVLPSEG